MKNKFQESSPKSDAKPHGGARPNAGRKKGVGNKLTEKLKAAALKKTTITPLEFMLTLMAKPEPLLMPDESALGFARRHESWATLTFEAAKAAAPYVHPKLQAIEHSGPDGGPVPHRIDIAFVPAPSRG